MINFNGGEIDFSRYLRGVENVGTEVDPIAQSALNRYERSMKKDEIITMVFSIATGDGSLVCQEGSCKIVLPNKEISGTEYELTQRAQRLNRSYAVKVLSVDYDKREVIVSHHAVRKEDREKLDAQLREAIKDNLWCRVPAKVIIVFDNLLLLDIGGLGVQGYLQIGNWSNTYINNLRTVAKPGDVIEVGVFGFGETKYKKRYFKKYEGNLYECSRKVIALDDPWAGIEEKIPEKSVVRVCCVERGEHNFFGTIDGIPEIQAYCYYPEEGASIGKKDIVSGCYYEGYVKKVSESEHKLRVRVFKRVDVVK